MRSLLFLILLFGFMSMFSCEKFEQNIDQKTNYLRTQNIVKFKNRSSVGQYNFSIELDTLQSATGILVLEWGNAKQKISLKFMSPEYKLEYNDAKQKILGKEILLPELDNQAVLKFEVSQRNESFDIHFNGELVHITESPYMLLGYISYNSYNTFNIISFSVNQ